MARRAPVVAALLLFAACTSGAPSPSPGGFQEVFEGLARRGAAVTQIVSGDPGCPDPSLVANAVRFHLRLADGVDREIHLFGFRDAAALGRAQGALNACRASFEARAPGGAASVGSVQVGPFAAFGGPWSHDLKGVLSDSLDEAIRGS